MEEEAQITQVRLHFIFLGDESVSTPMLEGVVVPKTLIILHDLVSQQKSYEHSSHFLKKLDFDYLF